MKEKDDLAEMYRIKAREAIDSEVATRLEQHLDSEEEEKWKSTLLRPLIEENQIEKFTRALLSRLGPVRAALIEHDGGMEVKSAILDEKTELIDVVINLTGGCVACGAAPGTLQSMVSDLGGDSEVGQVHFDSAIKDAQKPLIQEYLEQATGLEFVQVED